MEKKEETHVCIRSPFGTVMFKPSPICATNDLP